MKATRFLAVAAAATLAAVSLSSCAASAPAGDGTVEIAGGYGEAQAAAFQSELDEFGKANGIKIKFTSYASFDKDIKVKIASGDTPDIALWPQPGGLKDQYAEVDGVPILLFCCGWRELSRERQQQMGQLDATYSLAINADFSDVDFAKAKPFLHNPVYAGRLIQCKDGLWNLIGFENIVDGAFVGRLSDPIPVTANTTDGLVLRPN